MINRFLISFVGGSVITLGMFYGMAQVAELFEQRDPTQYFRITDVLLRSRDARPARPPSAAAPPERPAIEFDRPDTSLDVVPPSVEVERSREQPAIRPRLEPAAPAD